MGLETRVLGSRLGLGFRFLDIGGVMWFIQGSCRRFSKGSTEDYFYSYLVYKSQVPPSKVHVLGFQGCSGLRACGVGFKVQGRRF